MFSNTGNYKQCCQTNFGPEMFKNESTECTGPPVSSVRKKNLNPQTLKQKNKNNWHQTRGYLSDEKLDTHYLTAKGMKKFWKS